VQDLRAGIDGAAAAIAKMVQKEQDFKCDTCDEEYDREVGELEARLAEMREALEIVHERIKSWPELEPNEIGWARMQMVVEKALAAAGGLDDEEVKG